MKKNQIIFLILNSLGLFEVISSQNATLSNHTLPIVSITFTSDGMLATGSNDLTIKLWDPKKSWTLNSTISNTGVAVNALAQLPNRFLASSSNMVINIWDLSSIASPVKVLAGHNGNVRALAYSSTTGLLASGGGILF